MLTLQKWQKLQPMLLQLAGSNMEGYAIEYGDPKNPLGFLSLLRIRYMMTPAGMQYAIKEIHRGMEGSGEYYPSTHSEELMFEIRRRIEFFERPMPMFREQPKKKVELPELDFFLLPPPNQPVLRTISNYAYHAKE